MIMSGYPLVPYTGNMVPPQFALSQHLLNCAQASNQSPITIEKLAGKIWVYSDWIDLIKQCSDAIIEARYGSMSGNRKQRRSRTAFSAQQLQALERAFETTQVSNHRHDHFDANKHAI